MSTAKSEGKLERAERMNNKFYDRLEEVLDGEMTAAVIAQVRGALSDVGMTELERNLITQERNSRQGANAPLSLMSRVAEFKRVENAE